jgi:hypothetical protein
VLPPVTLNDLNLLREREKLNQEARGEARVQGAEFRKTQDRVKT